MSLPDRSVWIDVQGCQNTENYERGIARQAAESTRALLDVAPGVVHTVGLTPRLPVPASLDYLNGTGLLGWSSGKGSEPDPAPPVYHITSPFEGPTPIITLDDQWPHWARRAGTRLVITLHDLVPLLYPEHYIEPLGAEGQRWLSRLGIVRAADHILAVSQSSAADAVELLECDENRITVIDAGTSTQMASMVVSSEEAAKIVRSRFSDLRDGYLFYVGGGDWRKNVRGLIEAYGLLPARLRERHQLVITYRLSPREHRGLEELAAANGIPRSQLVLTGFVPDRELAALYRLCGLFVFPSLYEGAGLPILEAMACGAPVVGSSVSSVPEILGEHGATFDPSSAEEIAACLERTLDNPGELERLRGVSAQRVAHFTWERVARLSLEGYERALATPGRRDTVRGPRKRIAFFTPWPPDELDAAAYNRALAELLARRADVDVFVPRTDLSGYDRSLEPDVRIWAARDFDWVHELRDFDRVIYAVGNSRLHLPALRELTARPGTVIAHDIRLGELYGAAHRAEDVSHNSLWLREKLYALYGDRVPPADLRRAADEPEAARRFGVYMSQEVQAHAERILVDSGYAADALRMDLLPGQHGAEVAVVARGVPAAPVVRNGEPFPGRPVVISHGAEQAEAVDLLLHAFASLAERRPGARLVVIGRTEPAARARLADTAANLGIDDAVTLADDLDQRDYWATVAGADAAVQIRTSTDGEASGAVCDCLAARVPTIVSAVGWLAEQPEPAVIRVPRECSPAQLADRIDEVVRDPSLRAEIRAAQDAYAEANSFERVAERYAELLRL